MGSSPDHDAMRSVGTWRSSRSTQGTSRSLGSGRVTSAMTMARRSCGWTSDASGALASGRRTAWSNAASSSGRPGTKRGARTVTLSPGMAIRRRPFRTPASHASICHSTTGRGCPRGAHRDCRESTAAGTFGRPATISRGFRLQAESNAGDSLPAKAGSHTNGGCGAHSDGIEATFDFASVTSGTNAETATAVATTTLQPMTLYQRNASAVYFQQATMTS